MKKNKYDIMKLQNHKGGIKMYQNTPHLIALSGPMGVGKTTIAKQMNGFQIVSIGSTIKEICSLLIDDQKELKNYLNQILKNEEPEKINEVFNTLILHFESISPEAIWEKNKDGIYNKNKYYRELTQFVATYFRETYNEDIWVRFIASKAMELADQGINVVCDDMRFPSEKKVLEMFGFIFIRLDISKEEQKRRLLKDYGEIPENLLNHNTETALDEAYFDLKLQADGLETNEIISKINSLIKV